MTQSILRVLSAAISLYMLILLVRILMSWFQAPSYGRATMYLARITDPYLNVFRRMRFMRVTHVDFSPVLALITLSILNDIVTSLAFTGRITLGFILARLLWSLWSATSFFFTIFIILAIVRLVAILISATGAGRFWITIDRLLQPPSYWITRKLGQGVATYPTALGLFAAILFLMLLAGNLLIARLVAVLVQLPF